MEHSIHAVVLAAGKSSRFGTGQNKQLVEVCGAPMVLHSVELLSSIGLAVTVVLGHQADQAEKILAYCDATIAHQQAQKGTGDAVRCAQDLLTGDHILIINGDMPLVTQELISSLIHRHTAENNVLTFCTTTLAQPAGYGRVIVDKRGCHAIREEKECTDDERAITTVNAGIYLVARSFLEQTLPKLTASAVTGELYITDLVAHAGAQSERVATHQVDEQLVRGVNTLEELSTAENILYDRIRRRWQQHGVRFIDPTSILVERNVRIGRGSVIERGAHLRGHTIVGKNVRVEPYSMVTNSVLGDSVIIKSHSVLDESHVQAGAQIGPFARLRGHNEIGPQAVIGNFVEVKGTHIGSGVKAKHLSYLGDATIGDNANIGAGAVTCNYDGHIKHHTRIGNGAMVGANSSLVAPISIGADSYVAAGSTLTKDLPRRALGIGRARQVIKEEWAKARRLLGAVRVKEKQYE